MESVENVLHGLVGALSSWLPGGAGIDSPSLNMSREYWMPDQSCRVCYECESQFTIFNRRHHCRVCGLVFCGKCSFTTGASGILPEAHDDGERIRVCNFCFKLRQQQERGSSEHLPTPALTPTSSESSFFSSAMVSPGSSQTPVASENNRDDDPNSTFRYNHSFNEDSKELSSSFNMRSDDEEEVSRAHEREQGHAHADYDRISDPLRRSDLDDRSFTSESKAPSERSFGRKSCEDMESLEEEANFHGQLYEAAYREVEKSVDFENNLIIWFPPPPEDEEDEMGHGYEDEDDDDDEGGWGLPRSSGSMSSSEYRNRERAASEEHRKAMRTVVDGHFKALVAQLLKGENIPVEDEDEKDNWLEIVTGLALQAASIVKPDSSRGGSMDPGGYVKVKCIASGRRSDSVIVKGIVCKKNLAHKRMTTRFKNPRLLIIGGALEYQRVPNLLSSMDTLRQQERDYLNMVAARIEAHHPNVVIVEKGVSGFAQERLLQKEISLVQNVKRPLLERIARCTGAHIISAPDNLVAPKAGHCEHFHTEKFIEEHGSAGQGGKQLSKTLMFFEGCPKPLGCTALLRGANGDDLKKIKRVLQLSVFASYHLALETSFLADEGASLPDHRSPIVLTLPNKQSSSDRSITSIPGFTIPGTDGQLRVALSPHQATSSNNTSVAIRNSLSAAMAEGRPVSFAMNGFTGGDWDLAAQGISGLSASLRRAFGEEALRSHATQQLWSDRTSWEIGQQVSSEAQNEQEDDQSGKDDFPPTPSDHQSILVSLLTRCRPKGSVCERPNIVRIKYYGNSDMPLGRFLRDTLFDFSKRCAECDELPDAHIRCYTHRLGSLTISVRRMDDHVLPGEREGKIWMWHRCLKCPREGGIPPVTRRIVMSDAAWGLSFGKFLELSFSNNTAASRVAVCGHQLHRDCLRFYGFGNMIACFRYAPVQLHAIHLPPPSLEFYSPSQQEWLANEAKEVREVTALVFTEILNTLGVIGGQIASSGSFSGSGRIAEARKRAVYLEALFKKDKAEFEAALFRAAPMNPEPGEPVADVLELARLRKELVARATDWEKRLHYFASSHSRRFSTNSDSGVMLEQSKEKLNLLKTYSNTEVSQGYVPGADIEVEKPVTPRDDTALSSDLLCNVTEQVSCLPSGEAEGGGVIAEALCLDTSAVDGDDIRRTLSEGNCPVLADLSHTLEAAWSGENQGSESQANEEEREESSRSNDAAPEASEPQHVSESVVMDSKLGEDEELSSPPAHEQELTGLGNWIDGPFSTLHSLSNQAPASSIKCRALQEALQGGARLFFPEGEGGVVLPVYEDEPTSIIAHALLTEHYARELGEKATTSRQLSGEKEREQANGSVGDEASIHSSQSDGDGAARERSNSKESTSSNGKAPVDDPLLSTMKMNLKVESAEAGPDAKLKYTVTAYYAKHFDALRKKCCSGDLPYIRSLSRCRKWGAQGGKSNVFFAKTLDDRFIVKQVTRTELLSFLEFAPGYFKYLSDFLNSGNPTCLAKILGMYQVVIKQVKSGKEIARMELMVMENLLYGRTVNRLYDLKGSVRSRYNSNSTGTNAVLLDQNLLETMPTAPIFVGNKAKRLLERAVWNDTGFLANIDVMDYSLLVGIDEKRGELVLGIIDFMRQYTWDKHLETWVKASGILGGPKNAAPTVISPVQYKKRFRKAMSTYFVTVPDQWTPPPSAVISAPHLVEDCSSP